MCEGPGILVWALEGLRRLRQRGGFDVPSSVRAATEHYRVDNDLAAQFLAYADIKPGAIEVSAQSLTKAYNAWRDDNDGLRRIPPCRGPSRRDRDRARGRVTLRRWYRLAAATRRWRRVAVQPR